jgi:hypothetical protein
MKLERQVENMKEKLVRGFCPEKWRYLHMTGKVYLEEKTWMGVDQIISG